MKEKRILDALGEIDDSLIAGAAPSPSKIRRPGWIRWTAAAACLTAVLGITCMVLSQNSSPKNPGPAAGNSKPPAADQRLPQDSVSESRQPEKNPTEEPSEQGAVYYSHLQLPQKTGNQDAEALFGGDSADIAAFKESMLSEESCFAILEGTVTNISTKHYTYDVYDDKFGEGTILHEFMDTVIYEVAVDKCWYGEDFSGKTILIEDNYYCIEPLLALQTGGRYVIPIHDNGGQLWLPRKDYVGDEIIRESRYTTIYPHHPQIEVTTDGSYIVSEDWPTLISENARKIIIEALDEEYSYYQDKMYLVDAETFARQMKAFTAGIRP